MSNLEDLTALQKVAVFLIALGEDLTAEIMRYLSDQEAQDIALAITEMQVVNTELMDQVLEEFADHLIAGKSVSQGGADFARQALEIALGPDGAKKMMDRIHSNAPSGLDMLRGIDPNQILPVIRKEHPQTIALILAQLEPDQAASILSGLNDALQADVTYRMATLKTISPDVLQELEESLSEDLQAILSGHLTEIGGPKAVADILNHARHDTELNVLDHIDGADPELAEAIRNEMFVFDDIAQLTDQDIRELMKAVDPNDLAMALKSADTRIKTRFFSNLSRRRGDMLQEEIGFLGQVRLSDVQAAQQKIAQTVRQLEDQGQVRVVRADSDDVFI